MVNRDAGKLDEQDERTKQFVRLLSQCDRVLYAYVLSLVVDLEAADEIVQETKIKLWEQFDKFEPGTNFTAWATTVAHYEVQTYRHRSQTWRERFSQNFVEAVAAEMQDMAAQQDPRRAALGQCLSGLDEKSRVFVLRCYEAGVRIQDVAEEIGRTAAATYQRLWRIRRSLHECVERKIRAEKRP